MKTDQFKGNVIVFPRLFERHVNLAREAIRQRDLRLAKSHLEQALRIDPNHPEAGLDLMMIYHELGLYEDAVLLAGNMIRQGSGEFIDALRIYIGSLMKLERYERVCQTLSEILAEHTFSTSVYLEFLEIYQVCESHLKTQSTLLTDAEQSVARVIEDKTYHHDPTFSTFASQLWFEFLRVAGKSLDPIDQADEWAAAVHFATELSMGYTSVTKEIAALYGVTTDTLDARYQTIQRALHGDDG